jgi:tetratricopeptide (TPR) repeat protein/DNA-binding winged helix-turn-helix (wHTH) protein
MSKGADNRQLLEFGEFQLDPTERLLLRDGRPIPITPKAFDTLLVLVENSGRLLDKNELMQAVWPDTFVEEAGLTRNISSLRKALCEPADETRYIETVPRRGYRFVSPVRRVWRDEAGSMTDAVPAMLAADQPESVGVEVQTSAEGAVVTGGRRPLRVLLISTALVVAIAAAAYAFFSGGRRSVPEVGSVRTIAVLPFRSLGGPADEDLAIGMADTLITQLSNIREINVRPTSSVLKYAGSDQDWEAVGNALKVDAILEGSIQRHERLRVTVRLLSVRNGATLWAGKFDEEVKDILAIQDSISARVTTALQLQLSSQEKLRLARRYTDNSDAFQLYSRGRYFWNKRTRDGYKKAIELFRNAIDLDPTYALAYSGLADCYLLGGDASTPEEAFSRAKTAAAKAIEIDDSLAEAHASLALAHMAHDWDFAAAEAEFQRAINLNPNYPTAHQWYADCLLLLGRVDSAIASAERARELDPISLVISRDLGRVFLFAGKYDQAIEQCRKTLEMDPGFYPAHVTLGDSYVEKKAYEEAIRAYETVVSLSGGRLLMRASLARVYGLLGRPDEARRNFDELIEMSKQRPASAFDLAIAHLGLGDRDSAFEMLEKAYNERSYRLIYMLIDPAFADLRSDPRFVDLERRIRFRAEIGR